MDLHFPFPLWVQSQTDELETDAATQTGAGARIFGFAARVLASANRARESAP